MSRFLVEGTPLDLRSISENFVEIDAAVPELWAHLHHLNTGECVAGAVHCQVNTVYTHSVIDTLFD